MIQKLAWVYGGVFVLVGAAGFVPGLTPNGVLLGLFEVDRLHNIIHLFSGVAAMGAALTNQAYSRLYFKVFGLVYTVVTVAGFIQGDTVLGLIGVNMADNILHFALASIALYVGFGIRERESSMPPSGAVAI